VPIRQRVDAALDSSVCEGRSSNSGKPALVAARCNFWLVFRSSLSIMPMTACGAPERSASSNAHKLSWRCAVSTRVTRVGSNPRPLRPCPDKRPHWRDPWSGITKMICLFLAAAGKLELKRASTATMKPKAAGSAACVAGTISWSAPQVRPPFGKWQSSAARSKGSLACKVWGHPGCRDSKRRNSARATARLWTEGADGNAGGTSI